MVQSRLDLVRRQQLGRCLEFREASVSLVYGVGTRATIVRAGSIVCQASFNAASQATISYTGHIDSAGKPYDL